MRVQPLVSIGVPVRNGGALLDEALQQIVQQTYTNIEIVISDNNSIDQTNQVCKRFMEKDQRIRYFRQDSDLLAVQNFRFVLEHSTGDYFMWAAHDDRRSLNYVEVLLTKMLAEDKASIVFSDVTKFSNFEKWNLSLPIDYDFSSDYSINIWSKIRKHKRAACLHIYGLLRRQVMMDYNWLEIEFGPDVPLLFYLSCRGSFVKAKGSCFYCYKPAVKKSYKDRAKDNSFQKIKPFPNVRLYWACAVAGCHAEQLEGRRHNVLLVFLLFLFMYLCKRTRKKTCRFLFRIKHLFVLLFKR